MFNCFAIITYLTGTTPSSKAIKSLMGFPILDRIFLSNKVSGMVSLVMSLSYMSIQVSEL